MSVSRLANVITQSSLSQEEVELIMQRLLEKQDLNDEWEMVRRDRERNRRERGVGGRRKII